MVVFMQQKNAAGFCACGVELSDCYTPVPSKGGVYSLSALESSWV